MLDRTDRVGQQLGNYMLLRLLGRGGFAEVYLGEHRYLRTQAAVKILHTQLAQADIEGFLREAQMVARLRHHNIVRVLDFGVESSTPYLVMDYASYGTLRQRHLKATQVPLTTVVSYTKQIAEALQYAHEQRLIHRDVKPENMLVGDNQEILLSDFGIALAVQSTSSQSVQNIAGSIAYMAPEQIQAHPRPASDQYALGITVYEWLCGNRPFDGAYTEIAIKHTMVPPPPLRQWVAALAPAVEEVVVTALAKDPHRRFATVREFAQALERASTMSQQSVSMPYAPSTVSSAMYSHSSAPSIYPSTLQLPPSAVQTPTTHVLPPYAVPPSQAPSPSPASPYVPYAASGPHMLYPPNRPNSLYVPNTPQPYYYPVVPPGGYAPIQSGARGSKQGNTISRRLLLAGILGAAAAGSGITWFVASRRSPTSSSPLQISWPGVQTTAGAAPSSAGALVTYRGHTDLIWCIDWSHDGKHIVTGSMDRTAQVWNAGDGTRLFSYSAHPSATITLNWVRSVAWSRDSRRVATGFGNGSVVIWNSTTGQAIKTYQPSTMSVMANTVAWSPDEKYLVSGHFDNSIYIHEVATGKVVQTYNDHQDAVTSVAWSHDGQRIVSSSSDGVIKVWHPFDGHLFFNFLGHQNVNDRSGDAAAVAWSYNDAYIASAGNGIAIVWETKTGQTLVKYTQHVGGIVNSVAWSHNDAYVASGGNDYTGAHIWQAQNGTLVQKCDSHQLFGIAWSPDDTRLVTANYDKTAQVWKVSR